MQPVFRLVNEKLIISIFVHPVLKYTYDFYFGHTGLIDIYRMSMLRL